MFTSFRRNIAGFFVFFAALSLPCLSAREVSLNEIADTYGLSLSGMTMRGNGVVLSFKDKSRTFLFNGTPIPIGLPLRLQRNKAYINDAVFQKSVQPLLAPSRVKYKKIRTIALDAGHGGVDDGTESVHDRTKEKVINADICSRIASVLKKNGYNVVLTRPSDVKVELTRRSAIANDNKSDLFVSIHMNWAPSQSANGIETFILTPTGMLLTYGSTVQSQRLCGNKYDRQNTILGYTIQKNLSKKVGVLDRGVKYSAFTVLRDIDCPGALIECGFLSNHNEAAKLANPQYRQKVASAIASAIIEFANTCGK